MSDNILGKQLGKINWRESYGSLILGAIIVIVLGLLVANYLTKRGQQQIDIGEQTMQPAEAQVSQEYKVTVGDTLSAISVKFYQTEELWPVLARTNKIANPDLIFVDITLTIPPRDEAVKIREELTTRSYQVKEGETLFTIAEKVYGDGSKWVLLTRVNKVGRLANGNPLIFAGSTLVIPR